MKICCQLPICMPEESYGDYYRLLMSDYELVKDPDTEITIRDVPSGMTKPMLMTYLAFRQINDVEIVKAMIEGEEQGYDGIAGACYFDSGIKAARNLLSIPVVGAAEAAMHLAGVMGHKFAVVTSEEKWIAEMTDYLVSSGFSAKAITHKPVRSLSMSMEKMMACLMSNNIGPIVDDFLNIAKGCTRDGAEVIIAGCGLISPAFSLNGIRELDGAPIIDPMLASLKLTELIVKFAGNGFPFKSYLGIFQLPDQKTLKEGLEQLL